MRKASSTNIQDSEKLQTSSFKCFATCASRSGSSTKAAEGSRTPRPVGGLHRSQNARSVLECGCPLCTLHASPPLEPLARCTANSPSPRPSPQGEGGSPPIGRRIVCPGNVRRSGDASPSPRGEGRGEREPVVQRTSAFEMKNPCKVQCPLPLSLGLRTVADSFYHNRQFGAWCLKIIWILDVGAWKFDLALRNE